MNDLFDYLLNGLIFGLNNGSFTPDNIHEKYQLMKSGVMVAFANCDANVDDELIINTALSNYEITVDEPSFLDSNTDHEEWLPFKKADIKWNFWKRYRAYLETTEKLPASVVTDIDRRTDDILGRLEDPERSGAWDRRGLVIGNVQSGKTSNYVGLISKAVDAGYKVIIVLAGLNNDLRKQTQIRIDCGFVGRDSIKKDSYDQTSSAIGAGLLPGYSVPAVTTITTAELNGDYRKGAHSVTPTIGGDPIIAVVKKNTTPLKNLLSLFQGYNKAGIIPNAPLLLIDDEADNASIDTKAVKKLGSAAKSSDDETNPSKINELVRGILNCFSKSAYVGYTATPFANMFIYPDVSDKYGEDLFPRSFAAVLEAPSNYMGPDQLFGLYEDPIVGIEKREPYPLIRRINDYSSIFIDKHKKDLEVNVLPESLYHAMYSFILTICVRMVRGQGNKHQSMLVHVTRFIRVQHQVRDLILDWKETVERCLEMKTGPQYKNIINYLKSIWEDDYRPTMKQMKEIVNDRLCTDVSWENVEPLLYKCVSRVQVKEINGKAADGGLDYEHSPNGMYVIAIGGDKLSRGLTLEGLTISYYIRVSKMYDTLMQMGRWFGYRDGYIDVCRLYTSAKLVDLYQHIAVANLELRNEFKDMAEMNSDPEHYGIKIRSHPQGYLVTALNKMRNSAECKVTYSGKLIQIPRFYRNSDINKANVEFVSKWLIEMGNPTDLPSESTHWNYLWRNVTSDKVMQFLNTVRVHKTCFDASPDATCKYIEALNNAKKPELTNWTVEVVSNRNGTPYMLGNISINPTWRTDSNQGKDKDTVSMNQDSLITENHQDVDLSTAEKLAAYKDTLRAFEQGKLRSKNRPERPSPKYIRQNRKPENGLLIIQVFHSGISTDEQYDETYIGYGISFPTSRIAPEITYKIDYVYWEKMLENID